MKNAKLKIILVVGARPNFMKVAPIIRVMRRYPDDIECVLVHTGQHYDFAMSQVFFQDLDLPHPDEYLNVGSGSHAEQTARTMLAFDQVLQDYHPTLVVVVGDVNSTLACALVCAKRGVDIAHVEAGVRSFDMTMPEEVNRVLTDQVADLLFTPSPDANDNLSREGIPFDRIHFVGNVMIDSLVATIPKVAERKILTTLNLSGRSYVLATLHRPSNVDDPDNLLELLNSLLRLSDGIKVVFSMHPRTIKRIEGYGLREQMARNSNFISIEPQGYLDFLALMRSAGVVLTDSGGMQPETTYMGIPCVTVRPNTEWQITLKDGTNQLASCNQDEIVSKVESALSSPTRPHVIPELWDGRSAERVVEVLTEYYV